MSERDPADQSEKRDWDLPASTRHAPEPHEAARESAEPEAPHPSVHGETPDDSERRDWDVP